MSAVSDVDPPALPARARREEILSAVFRDRVTVISGDTGCGKSSQVPQFLLDAGPELVEPGMAVVCTQPRRVAAITLAEYVASLRGSEVGAEVGYQIRFHNVFCESTRLLYCTTAVVLRRLHVEPGLDSVAVLVLDEVHERDMYTDHLLLLLRCAMMSGHMPHLRLVLMSATINPDEFADFFRKGRIQCGVPLHIEGRMYPVDVAFFEDACQWTGFVPQLKRTTGLRCPTFAFGDGEDGEPPSPDLDRIRRRLEERQLGGEVAWSRDTLVAVSMWKEKEVYVDLVEKVVRYLDEFQPNGDGAILVFMPGWKEISDMYLRLADPRNQCNSRLHPLVLHSLMTPEQQHEAFARPPAGRRKVIVSSNIAEASVTIDDVVYVVDSAVRKERIYHVGCCMSALEAMPVTKANVLQRRGRAGRLRPGLAVHLLPSWQFGCLRAAPAPAMLSSSLEDVFLHTKLLLTDLDTCEALTSSMAAPSVKTVRAAIESLQSLGVLTVEAAAEVTVLGRAVAAIPVDPKVAKMLLLASVLRCLEPVAVVAAFQSLRNPFQQHPGCSASDHKRHFGKGRRSDHLCWLEAFVGYQLAADRDQFCFDHSLSPEVMDMANKMVADFLSFLTEAGYDVMGGGQTLQKTCLDVPAPGSPREALMQCAIHGAFGNTCCIYANRRSRRAWGPALWRMHDGRETSAFPGSVNFEMHNPKEDGQNFMLYTSVMQLGLNRRTSILESGPVETNVLLLFAERVALDAEHQRVRFDTWSAETDITESTAKLWHLLVALRESLMNNFERALTMRDLSAFPPDLAGTVAEFARGKQLPLRNARPNERPPEEEACVSKCFRWRADPEGHCGSLCSGGTLATCSASQVPCDVAVAVSAGESGSEEGNGSSATKCQRQTVICAHPLAGTHLPAAAAPQGQVPTTSLACDQDGTVPGACGSNSLDAWLRGIDPDGFLDVYAEKLRGLKVCCPAEVVRLYALPGGFCVDERFFADMAVNKLGHRRLFEHWFRDGHAQALVERSHLCWHET